MTRKENVCLCGCFHLVKGMFVHGHNKPWLGKPVVHSLMTKQKMSRSRTGKIVSKETRARMSRAQIGKIMSRESRMKMSLARSMPLGSTFYNNGYVIIKTQEGWKQEHRVIMEGKLGRRLDGGEVVHHRNGNKTDNRVKNLRLMTDIEHTRLHRLLPCK